MATSPFPADALEANRAGKLSPEQRTWLRGLAKDWRSNGRFVGGALAAVGFIVLFLANSGGASRILWGAGFLIVGGFLFVLSLLGADTMDADLRDGKVESVEGAISKRTETTRNSSSSSSTKRYIDVENKQMIAFRDQYEAAPDAGWVRVYYVPHSMRVVNLERLPDKAVPADAMKSPQDALKLAVSGLVGFDEVRKAEARAEMAAIGHVMQPGAPPPASQRDPRPLADAILGKWTNGMVTLEFGADSSVSMSLPGGTQRQSHWSVDGQGRLVVDMQGEHQASEAWIAADHLNITLGGDGIVLKRA